MKYYYLYNPFDKLHTIFVNSLLYTIYDVGDNGKEIKEWNEVENFKNEYDEIVLIYIAHPIYLYKNQKVNHFIQNINQKKNIKKILYIMEPLTDIQTRILYKRIIRTCHIRNIWTYSKGNMKYIENILPNIQLKSVIKMVVMSPYYNDFINWRFQMNIEKDMNKIVFIGNVTEMRRNKLERIQREMTEKGLQKEIEIITDRYEINDWKWIVNRYQYFINIHRIDGCLNLETFRIYLLLGNGCIVFSECIGEDEIEEYMDTNLYVSNIDNMVNQMICVMDKSVDEIEDRYVHYKMKNMRELWINVNMKKK